MRGIIIVYLLLILCNLFHEFPLRLGNLHSIPVSEEWYLIVVKRNMYWRIFWAIDWRVRIIAKLLLLSNITFTEFEILYLLASSPGRVFSKEQIYDIVWKESYSGDYNIVMSHIRNIREKIEDNPSKPIYIQTVWRVGYRFNKNLIPFSELCVWMKNMYNSAFLMYKSTLRLI